ncbi:ribbon-helix-helix domain-containing protein [Azospirillum sp.]|uniref:ribbon-helix-helix domain-containing protein n=1 Tax=Azospirillum sp. TaxID=34012 RepID=UPI002D4CD0A9|nr:ribbon-helix-helix domain-containing protein [Azospirillum sp.]HYF87643.1 ribbon-helix-helix domain-containing protein [Azospirillum sp.]
MEPDGKLTLPQSVRDRLRLGSGLSLRVEVSTDDHGLALSPADPPLEPYMWEALEDIGRREGLTVNGICTQIKERIEEQARRKGINPEEVDVTLTSAVRVFIASYYRRACEGGAGTVADPFAGTPLALPEVAATATSPGPEYRIEDLFGIVGRSKRAVSIEEMDKAIQDAAAERFRQT